uniref:Uncharacterized protein n=1 Tax=Salmo trutta TaxID=8032 RepID=A0A674ERT3_SALTR
YLELNMNYLSGDWKNELGSLMTLKFEPNSSAFSGTYRSYVGEVHPNVTKELYEPLVGFYNNLKEPQMPTIAFCISWGSVDRTFCAFAGFSTLRKNDLLTAPVLFNKVRSHNYVKIT